MEESSGGSEDEVLKEVSEGYRKLFDENAVPRDIGFAASQDEKPLASTLGIVDWAEEEKTRLLDSLGRKRFDALPLLPYGIGGKTAPEAQAYVYQLSHDQNEVTRKELITALRDFPAAVEIDEGCSAQLDRQAAALRLLEQRRDEDREAERFSHLWLLDWRSLSKHRRYREGSKGQTVATNLQNLKEAHALLDLRPFLELSFSSFMSSEDPDMDWESYSEEGPSLFASTFTELYQLVHDITRRLVAASLFNAQSRLRATWKYTNRKESVRRQDAVAAVNLLGLPKDSWEYWTKFAQRCRLKVLQEKIDEDHEEHVMSHDEVEESLGRSHVESQSLQVVPLKHDREHAAGAGQTVQSREFGILATNREHELDSDASIRGSSDNASETSVAEDEDHQASFDAMRKIYRTLGLEVPKRLWDKADQVRPRKKPKLE